MLIGAGGLAFGGPDLPARRLRDLLETLVDAAPPGSRIDWATYYFRDRALAQALIRASDRGVRVKLVLDGHPRRAGANDAVIAQLASHSLGGGLYVRRGGALSPGHLHSKIYAFADCALIGSFNPSGNDPEDADVIAEIGDQDRGHNLLLRIDVPAHVAALRAQVERLARRRSSLIERFAPDANRVVAAADASLRFYPRLRTLCVEPEIDALASGDRFRGAISHLKAGPLTAAITRAVRRGVATEILVHDTERRVPTRLVAQLAAEGAAIRRVVDPQGLPMHAKFLLLRRRGRTAAWLGSYNYNPRSRWLNAELLYRTTAADTIAVLDARFAVIAAMAEHRG